MAIDYRILQPWSYETPNQLARQSASLRQMATSEAMNQQAMAQGQKKFANEQQLFGQQQQEYAANQQAAQIDAQENEQLKQLFPNFVNPETKEIDIDGFYNEAVKINPKKANQFRTEYAEYQKLVSEKQKNENYGVAKTTDYDKKMDELRRISSLPEGPEKEAAMSNFMTAVAPGTYYPTSPAGVKAKAGAFETLAPIEAKAAGQKSFATESGKEATTGGKQQLALGEQKIKEGEKSAVGTKIALDAARSERNNILSSIDEIANSKAFATGFNPARAGQIVPGTKGYDWVKKVDNLKAKLALNERQKLKGQGQISDKESEMLNNAVSMLNTNLSKEAFNQELNRLKNVIKQMDESDNGGQTELPRIKSDEDYDKLQSGQSFIDPYGNKRRKP